MPLMGLNLQICFLKIIDFFQTLAASLQQMLDFDGDVQETFMQTFRISYTDVFGANLTHDLKENPP